MGKIYKIETTAVIAPKRKRVAAYARVSRDTERLSHSLFAQTDYYSMLIQGNPEWEYAGVYADLGISGTGTERRDGFRRLMDDCEDGKIDIVLTKSISRFARNTVDLLGTVRHLKSLGIEVRFEKEHINSMDSDGELMLTILASFAQEESRSISENCKWGIRKRFQSGEAGVSNKHLLGYRYDEGQKKYVVIPKEAEIVRQIFQMYLDGLSLREMAGTLNEAGLRTVKGRKFGAVSLNGMIHNEIYAGDILRQKSYVADAITKNKARNRGQLPQYYMADCHQAIIDRDTYEKVQAEMGRRRATGNPACCFTGRIKCGVCGTAYTRKKSTARGKTYVYWICRAKKEAGKTCAGANFREDELERICVQALGMDEFDGEVLRARVKGMTILGNDSIRFQFAGGGIKIWKR